MAVFAIGKFACGRSALRNTNMNVTKVLICDGSLRVVSEGKTMTMA